MADKPYYASAIITTSMGAYLRATPIYNGNKIIPYPLMNVAVYILDTQTYNGFYRVLIRKNGISYTGYMLMESLKIVQIF